MSSEGQCSHSRQEVIPVPLQRIHLQRFKCVDRAEVALYPLSIVVGSNSSGKSTLLQSLLAIIQVVSARRSGSTNLLNGDLHTFGTYSDVRNFRTNELHEKTRSEAEARWAANPGLFLGMTLEQYLSVPDFGGDEVRIGFRIAGHQRYIDLSVSIVEDKDANSSVRSEYWVSLLDLNSPASFEAAVPVTESLLDELIVEGNYEGTNSVSWEGPDLADYSQETPAPRLRGGVLTSFHGQTLETLSDHDPIATSGTATTQMALHLETTDVQGTLWSANLTATCDDDGQSANRANAKQMLKTFVDSVGYLGPLRATPQEMAQADLRTGGVSLGKTGDNTAAVLYRNRNTKIIVPMPNGYEGQVRLGDATNAWLEWFGLGDAIDVRPAHHSIDLNVTPPRAARSVDLASLGVGVTQVLPILQLCLLSKPGSVLIIEHPELHLHPALQKRMADFLLVFVRAGRQMLVETHSDHLVNQLRYQVAADETNEIKDLVKLIFAEQTDGITTYRESEINEYGGLSEDWPDGFLDISAKSAQDLVRHGLRKWKLREPRPGEGN